MYGSDRAGGETWDDFFSKGAPSRRDAKPARTDAATASTTAPLSRAYRSFSRSSIVSNLRLTPFVFWLMCASASRSKSR